MASKDKKICRSMNGDVLFEYTGNFSDAFNRYKEYQSDLASYPGTLYEDYRSDFILPAMVVEYRAPHFLVDLSNFNVETCGEGLEGFSGTVEDYHGSSFRGSSLYWGLLADSNLEDVDFSFCDLRGVVFDDANLQNANFNRANLGFANIGKGATLFGANLTGANLIGANLEGTCYDSNTIFPDGFVVPDVMIKKHNGEPNGDFLDRCMSIKAAFLDEFSAEESQLILNGEFPRSIREKNKES